MRAVERVARPLQRIPAQHGFTLIEVIVALVVVSLGMLGVIQVVSQNAGNTGYLRDKTLAHWVGMNRLTEARLQKTPPGVAKTSDQVEMAGRRWKWTMNVTQTAVETIRRIDITVRPDEAREGTSLASVTGFYGAAIAPPGSALISWQGTSTGGPARQGDQDEEREEQPNQPPGEDEQIPEPEEPPDAGDPSDPTRQQ